jgi:uncharacterized membrane protein
LQLGCIGFIPFPTSVIGAHVSNAVAQQFYLGTLLVSSLAWVLLRWYATARHRLVSPDLSSRDLRFYLRNSVAAPVAFVVLMALTALGVGRLINPLLVTCFMALAYIALSGLSYTWEERREALEEVEAESPKSAPEKQRRADKEGSEEGKKA